jgi:hypothetical protein
MKLHKCDGHGKDDRCHCEVNVGEEGGTCGLRIVKSLPTLTVWSVVSHKEPSTIALD